MPDLYDEATKVTAKNGTVVLDGPDGVDVALTPEAALETSDRLLAAGTMAHGQQVAEALEAKARAERRGTPPSE